MISSSTAIAIAVANVAEPDSQRIFENLSGWGGRDSDSDSVTARQCDSETVSEIV